MGILRTSHNKENPYIMLNKGALEDPQLSWEAKGLWAFLMSKPDDWEVSIVHLSTIYKGKKRGGGGKAIINIINELIKSGYAQKIQNKKEKGYFGKVEYIITEFKIILPLPVERLPVERLAVDRIHTNKGVLLSNEERQQDPVSFVVFSCLKNIGLKPQDQESLTQQFQGKEEDIINAVELATRPDFKPQSLAAYINRAAKNKWKLNKETKPTTVSHPVPESDDGDNRALWREFNREFFHKIKKQVIDVGSKINIETPFGGIQVEFRAKSFRSDLQKALKKADLLDQKMINFFKQLGDKP